MYGWTHYLLRSPVKDQDAKSVGRILIRYPQHYEIMAADGPLLGVVRKKMRTEGPPEVGDWVLFDQLPGERKAVIREILPRFSKLSRKAKGKRSEEQIFAANIDTILIVQSADANFNLNRLERTLVAARAGGAEAVIVLNKTDLGKVGPLLDSIGNRLRNIPIVPVSARDGINLSALDLYLLPGHTIVFVGSSGVGKSSIVNRLLGSPIQSVQETRNKDAKGRHTTTRREMFLLPGGAILVDTPGIRELQLWADEAAVEDAFKQIGDLIAQCRFKDCDHQQSKGCAVRWAVEQKKITQAEYENFLKLHQEAGRKELSTDVARKKSKKKISRAIRKFYEEPN